MASEQKRVKVKDLILNPINPRTIKDEKFKQLKKSISDFPEMLDTRPIVVNNKMEVLGGNMRLRAMLDLGIEYADVVVVNFTDAQQAEFIIKDNLSFGEWDWDALANEWDSEKLQDWGLDLPGFEISDNDTSDSFSLKDGEKAPFQQITYTLADEQAEVLKTAIADIKETEEYKYIETFGNENSNGNALYLIVSQWAAQKK